VCVCVGDSAESKLEEAKAACVELLHMPGADKDVTLKLLMGIHVSLDDWGSVADTVEQYFSLQPSSPTTDAKSPDLQQSIQELVAKFRNFKALSKGEREMSGGGGGGVCVHTHSLLYVCMCVHVFPSFSFTSLSYAICSQRSKQQSHRCSRLGAT
jgi:CO dehydrogenase nickel-insertion accessory protein CooC1